MRVCDITRNDEVVAKVRILVSDIDNPEADDFLIEFEVGKAAHEALLAKDWGALRDLTPYNLRPKNPAKQAAAKKAGKTRAANRREKAGEAPLPAPVGPEGSTGHNQATAPAESSSGPHSGSDEENTVEMTKAERLASEARRSESGDPGF